MSSSSDNCELLPDNPILLKGMVGKTITIKTVKGDVHTGVVYVIDPINKTVVLLTADQIVIIPHHGIKSVEVSDVAVDEDIAKFTETKLCDSAEDIESKDRLMKWLKHMYIDVEECEDCLKIGEHVTIVAPYNKDSCICENTVILEKFRNMIEYMPANFT